LQLSGGVAGDNDPTVSKTVLEMSKIDNLRENNSQAVLHICRNC
jgi:hypothetical protein